MEQKRNTEKQMSSWSLDDWADNIWGTFQDYDRFRMLSDIWGSVVIYASSIAEGLRKAEYCEVLHGIAHTFVWIASFVAKLKNDISVAQVFKVGEGFADIVALKYPNSCSYCGFKPCTCGLSRGKLEEMEDKELDYRELREKRDTWRKSTNYTTWSLDLWVETIEQIYKNSFRFLPIEVLGFHLSEEIGECHKALRELINLEGVEAAPEEKKRALLNSQKAAKIIKRLGTAQGSTTDNQIDQLIEWSQSKLEVEIADSFSWLCSVYTRAKYVISGAQAEDKFRQEHSMKDADVEVTGFKSFSELLRNRFESEDGKFECDDCGQTKCHCALFPVRYIASKSGFKGTKISP